jgi:ribonuclease-3
MTNSPRALGHSFADARLLEQALTHRSAGRRNNERLEFLGDALLNLIVAEHVFDAYPAAAEGEMTRLRAALVNGTALAELAREETLGDLLVLGAGELKTGGFRRESILADTFEALIAAVYLDAGWNACRALVRRLFANRIEEAHSRLVKDPKTTLQELLQANAMTLPAYDLVSTHGDDHEKTFEVACSIGTLALRSEGRGSSRRAAEQMAAEAILGEVRSRIEAGRKKRKP